MGVRRGGGVVVHCLVWDRENFCLFNQGKSKSRDCLVASLEQGIKILPNSGQEQGKGLEEPAAHTHEILWRIPPPHPSPSLYQNYTKCWSETG